MAQTKSPDTAITWEIAVPLLSNPLIVGATFKVFVFAALGVAALMTLIFAVQGEFAAIGPVWLGFGAVGLGLFVLGLAIMALVFGNRLHCRFTIDSRGILYETIDRRAQTSNRLLLILGLLLGKPQAIGAGLIARSQEVQALRWRGAFRAEYRPERRVVILRNRWRRLLLVFCSPENYASVAERIAAELQRHGTVERVPTRSPVPRYLLQTALVVLACVPLFGLVDAFDVSLMLPLLQLCFGLATVWLIGLFGYVLLTLDLVIVGAVLLDALGMQESWLHRGENFARWTVYSDQDWGLLLLAAIGMAVLAVIGWRGARGRLPAMLMADFGDAGE
jgi:hypothetical protein